MEQLSDLPVVVGCFTHLISKNGNLKQLLSLTALSSFKVYIQKNLQQYCMSVAKQDTTYLYLQPIKVTLTTLTDQAISSSFHEIQLVKDDATFEKNKKIRTKITDMMKMSKQYRVYCNELHFYNTVFQVCIKNLGLRSLKADTLALQLAGNHKTRKYPIRINSLVSDSQGKQNLVNKVTFESVDDKSKLLCNVIVSSNPYTLAQIQQMLDGEQEYEQRSSSQLFQSDFFETNASSIMKKSVREKFQRSTKLGKTVSTGKFVRRSKKRLLSFQKKQGSSRSLLSVQSKKEEAMSVELNTSVQNQSPKLKRICRLRRSMLIPQQLQSQIDQEEFVQTMSQYKKIIANGFQNIIVVLGVFMIYAMMLPCKKL